jgi:hypothetical protein
MLAPLYSQQAVGFVVERDCTAQKYRVVLHFARPEEKIHETEASINLVALASPH